MPVDTKLDVVSRDPIVAAVKRAEGPETGPVKACVEFKSFERNRTRSCGSDRFMMLSMCMERKDRWGLCRYDPFLHVKKCQNSHLGRPYLMDGSMHGFTNICTRAA